MNTDYNLFITQLNSAIIEIENNLTTDITNEMTENNYVKFYFDGFSFMFEDNDNKKYEPSIELMSVLDMYYGTLNINKIEIYL